MPSGRTVPNTDSEWVLRGACRDVDPESLFVVGAAQHKAKVICTSCPVRIECLADALDSRTEFGVWGGMTERERRTMLRRRPDVTSWWDFLHSAQAGDEYRVSATPRLRSVPSQPRHSAAGDGSAADLDARAGVTRPAPRR